MSEESYCKYCGREIKSGDELRAEFHRIFPDCDISHVNLHSLHRILDKLKEKEAKKK